MFSKRSTTTAFFVLFLFLCGGRAGKADDKSPPKPKVSGGCCAVCPPTTDFTGKILALRVVVSGKDDYGGMVPLENASVRTIANTSYYVGKAVKMRNFWFSGKTAWVKVDNVVQIVEFESVNEFEEAYGSTYPFQSQSTAPPTQQSQAP
jgi:hypothetical protein